MTYNQPQFNQALKDFTDARRKASMQEILARLSGQNNELLSYDEVAKQLRLSTRSERGIQQIPLESIVGSVGRYTDFTRTFMPKSSLDKERWARVKAAMEDPLGPGWPPIDVYKVGEVYFVLDGNHRVSVARQEGFSTIEAHVIEVQTSVPLSPNVQPDDLIIKAEYAKFLEDTNLNNLHPNVDLSVSIPGQYDRLVDHIQVHQYFMGLDLKRDISYPEAVSHWLETVYQPMVEPIRERGLLRWFPERTETDLYLWVSEHRAALEAENGWQIRPENAAEDLAQKINPKAEADEFQPGHWRESKILDRYTDTLFQDILVAFSGAPESWQALEQALLLAKQEQANIHGLHIQPHPDQTPAAWDAELAQNFGQRLAQDQLSGQLAEAVGDVTSNILERSLLADLIVLHVAHPPADGFSGFSSGLREIISRAPRPILTVPDGPPSPLNNILLAYDGSPKSHEALFVATYLAEKGQAQLTVFTLASSIKNGEKIQQQAKAYLELHEIKADYLIKQKSANAFKEAIQEQQINLIVMGGYGKPAWQQVFIGSTVNQLLREAQCPLLICR